MRIADIMTRDVHVISPDRSIQDASRLMAELDVGALPVGENDRLIGMLTDRDITVRVVAEARSPVNCRVGDVMSRDIKYVYEDESTEDLARNMGDLQIRRMPVLNRETAELVAKIAALPDMIKGYGYVKDENYARYQAELKRLLASFDGASQAKAA